jgi:hypothetical protein
LYPNTFVRERPSFSCQSLNFVIYITWAVVMERLMEISMYKFQQSPITLTRCFSSLLQNLHDVFNSSRPLSGRHHVEIFPSSPTLTSISASLKQAMVVEKCCHDCLGWGGQFGLPARDVFLFSAPRKRGNTCPCAKCMIFECFHNITPCRKAVRMGILHEKSNRRRSVHGLVKFRAVIPVLAVFSA